MPFGMGVTGISVGFIQNLTNVAMRLIELRNC